VKSGKMKYKADKFSKFGVKRKKQTQRNSKRIIISTHFIYVQNKNQKKIRKEKNKNNCMYPNINSD